MASNGNGRNTYNSSVSKFLNGGRITDALTGKNKIVNGMEDPSFFAFTFGIDTGFTGLFTIKENLGIYDTESDRNYSVLSYLENAISPNTVHISEMKGSTVISPDDLYDTTTLGQMTKPSLRTFPEEYKHMKKFVEGFQQITVNHPYMMQSVEGLQEAYKKYFNSHKESYLGGGDTKIKIKCLESMDLRMSALFDSYFRAVYNHKYRRMNIPINLLMFDCWILVHDLRNLRINDSDLSVSLFGGSITKEIATNLSTILFRFKNCYFDVEEIGSMLTTVTNAESNQTTFEFAFNYTDIDVWVNSLADMLEASSDEDKANISKIYSDRYNTLDIVSLNEDLGSLNISNFLRKAGSAIFNYTTQGAIMGNVYDDSWAGLLSSMMSSITYGGVQSILNNALGKGTDLVKNKTNEFLQEKLFDKRHPDNDALNKHGIYYSNTIVSQSNHERDITPIGSDNVYDNGVITHETLISDNIYSDSPSQHEQFTGGNIDMSTNGSHEQLEVGSVDMTVNSHEQFTGGNIDMSTNGSHEQLEVGSVDMTVNSHEQFTGGNIDMSTNGSHEQLEAGKVFEYPNPVKNIDDLGNVYTITVSNVRYIPVNVFDRIGETGKGNDISIEKIFIPPIKNSKLEQGTPQLIKETKALTSKEMNANAANTKQKIKSQIYNIGNIYN